MGGTPHDLRGNTGAEKTRGTYPHSLKGGAAPLRRAGTPMHCACLLVYLRRPTLHDKTPHQPCLPRPPPSKAVGGRGKAGRGAGRQAGRQARGAGREGGRDTILMGAVRREGQINQAGIIISIIKSQKTPSKHCSHEQVLMSTGHPTLTPYLRRVRRGRWRWRDPPQLIHVNHRTGANRVRPEPPSPIGPSEP